MNDLELIDEIVKRAEEHQKQREKEFAIAELEKIKAEIENEYPLKMPTHSRAQGKSVGYGLHIALDIVNKRISELKGENNEV